MHESGTGQTHRMPARKKMRDFQLWYCGSHSAILGEECVLERWGVGGGVK